MSIEIKMPALSPTMEEGTLAKWEATSWAKKRKAHALRASATDFDRFQVPTRS